MVSRIKQISIQIAFMIIHMTYSISYFYEGNNDVLWIFWGIINIIFMFLSIGNAENVNRQVFGENKTKYLIFLSIDTAILLLLLLLGFYVSVLGDLQLILLISYVFGCFLLVLKALILLPENNIRSKSKEILFEKIHQVNTLDINENTDASVIEKKNIITASAVSTIVLGAFIVNFIVFSAFNKDVTIIHELLAIIFVITAIVLNTIKLSKLNKASIYQIWETGMLVLSMIVYDIFQLYIFQVTFNIPLMIVCILMLIPLLKTQVEIHDLMEIHFSE